MAKKTKSEMAYEISMKKPHNTIGLYWNHFSYEEVKEEWEKVTK